MPLSVSKRLYEEVSIECPMSERALALEFIYKDDSWSIKRSGPKKVDSVTCDMDIFHLVAQRRIRFLPDNVLRFEESHSG